MATQLKEPEPQIDEPGGEEVQTAPERDYESEARQHGWRPKEEFKGDEARWTDAKTFMDRADEVLPFIKKQNSALKTKVDILERMVKKVQKSEMAAYDNALAAIKAQMKDAVAVGDEAAFDALDAKAEKLRKDMGEGAPASREPPSAAEASKAFVAARKENPWFDKGALASASEMEAEARIRATQIFEEMVADGEDKLLAPGEFFEKAFAQVHDEFPDLTKKPARVKPLSDVAGVTRANGNRNAKTGANLPPDAKAQAKRFFEQGIIKADNLTGAYDKYAQSYDWN